MKSSVKYMGLTALLILIAAFAGYEYGHRSALSQPGAQGPLAVGKAQENPTQLKPAIVGAHYFGRHWPKNFINAFRREDVLKDFAQLRAEGFNTVVLLVSWGDFQPVFEPCCQYDERAFERLSFLIERAREAGLEVALRIGYGWTFHPEAGEVGVRIHRLLNDPRVREAFLAYVTRIGHITRQHSNVRLSFLSWEDLWLHQIDPQAKENFRRFLDSLSPNHPWRNSVIDKNRMPAPAGTDAPQFHAYWDWLLMQDLFQPAAERLPRLTFEARIDREPQPYVDAAGKTSYTWIGHEATYHPPGADVISLYWAPFWGARNEGEQLDAEQSLHLLGALLDDVRQHSGGLPMFVDQFNVIDNTLGFERNATLRPDALPAFMEGALCTLRSAGVFGYAYWTTHDYAESPLYNPGFAYKLEGWNLTTSDGALPQQRLSARASGDFEVRIVPGDHLTQTIPARRGRLPGSNMNLSTQICITARADEPSAVEISAGGVPVRLSFSGEVSKACSAISPQPEDAGLELEIHGVSGAPFLSSVMLFDHIQEGGLHHFDGSDGTLLPSLLKFNQRFADPASDCK